MVSLWSKLAEMSTPEKTSNYHKYFPLRNLSHCEMLNSKVFGQGFITLSRLTCRYDRFSKTAAYVIPSKHWYYTKVHKLAKCLL